MTFSSRTFMIMNAVLIVLIGSMVWFLSTNKQTEFLSLPVLESSDPVIKNAQAIRELQSKLALEKARADSVRMKMQARQLAGATKAPEPITRTPEPPAPTTAEAGLDVQQQKLQIAQMIKAQLEGAKEENSRLNLAQAKKTREIEQVRQQNRQLAKKMNNIDSNAQTLLSKLTAEGKKVSRSDQDYIDALQGKNRSASTTPSADTDLINRIEVADDGDTGTVAAKLRSQVNTLMEDEGQAKAAISKNLRVTANAQPGQSANLQDSVNAIMDRNDERASELQFQADSEYMDSLTPMEKERLNETRWVTVRDGDTLFDIAARVYNDGWLYTKIFEANPQFLSNPDRIKTGQRLRVPL